MKTSTEETIAPAVHMEFIQNQAGLSEADGAEEIAAYHRALFLHHHAHELERFQQETAFHQGRLDHLEQRLEATRARLAGLDTLLPASCDGQPDVQPTAPWNAWDRAMFGAALAGIAGLLVFGVLNVSFNLLESGLVTFQEHPFRAYLWAALLPVGALAVKVGWDLLRSRRLRDLYLWGCLALGIAGVLVWVGSYAAVYPALSKSVDEHIESLRVFDGAGEAAPGAGAAAGGPRFDEWQLAGAKWIDAVTVAAQAMAEIFLSAVLGMYLTVIYARHRPVRLPANPMFVQLDAERRRWEEDVSSERLALARAKGNQTRLENQLAALLSFAKSIYQKETVLRRDESHQKRVLLDQISEQLSAQLASVGRDGAGSRNSTSAAAMLDRGNGR